MQAKLSAQKERLSGLQRSQQEFVRAQRLLPIALPIEGVDIILGNDLASSRVWAKCPPPPTVSLSPSGEEPPESVGHLPVVPLSLSETEHPDESAVCFPQVFPACVIMQAMSRAESKGTDGKIDTVCHVCQIFLCLYPTVNCRVIRELTNLWMSCLCLC